MDHRHRAAARPATPRAPGRATGRRRRMQPVDVELDLEAAAAARSRRARSRASAACSTRRVSSGTGVAVLEPGLRRAASRSMAPTAGRGSSPDRAAAGGCWRSRSRAAPSATPGSKTRYAVRSEVSLSRIVLTMPTPLSKAPASARGDQRLAAQHAVQVAPADAHGLDAPRPRCAGRRRSQAAARAASSTPQRARRAGSPGGLGRGRLARRSASPSPAAASQAAADRLARAASVQWASQRSAGAMQSIVSGPISAAASSARERHRRPPAGAHRLDRLQRACAGWP